MGVECVGGDHHAVKVELGQQRPKAGDLFGRAADLLLGQHRAAGVVHRRQQVHRAAVAGGGAGATQGLAVDRHRPLPWPPPLGIASAVAAVMALAVGEPGADRGGQGVGVQPAERAADGASAGTAQWSGASRRAPSAARTGWGASVAHSAMAANERAPASTAAAARARMATSGWRRPRAPRGSGMVAR